MNFLGSLPAILLSHILPGILAAVLYFLLAQFFILIFRLKKPAYRYAIYLLVLFKSVLAFIIGMNYSYTLIPRKPFGFGGTLYDPFNIIPAVGPAAEIENYTAIASPWLVTIITFALVTITGLIVLRWAATVWFFAKVLQEKPLTGNSINRLTKQLSAKMKLKEPSVIISNQEVGPLTIGIFKPTIVLPGNLLNVLPDKELKVIIGHELAHVKRRDNWWQWLSLFLKDLLFFSPFSLLTYRVMQAHKEMAADSLYLKYWPDNKSLLKSNIEKIASLSLATKSQLLIAKASFVDINAITRRLSFLNKPLIKKQSLIKTSFNIFGLVLFFWFQIWIAVKLTEKSLMLLP